MLEYNVEQFMKVLDIERLLMNRLLTENEKLGRDYRIKYPFTSSFHNEARVKFEWMGVRVFIGIRVDDSDSQFWINADAILLRQDRDLFYMPTVSKSYDDTLSNLAEVKFIKDACGRYINFTIFKNNSPVSLLNFCKEPVRNILREKADCLSNSQRNCKQMKRKTRKMANLLFTDPTCM